jgi:hypothetical protein
MQSTVLILKDYGKDSSEEVLLPWPRTIGNSVRFRYLYLNDILAVHKILNTPEDIITKQTETRLARKYEPCLYVAQSYS